MTSIFNQHNPAEIWTQFFSHHVFVFYVYVDGESVELKKNQLRSLSL